MNYTKNFIYVLMLFSTMAYSLSSLGGEGCYNIAEIEYQLCVESNLDRSIFYVRIINNIDEDVIYGPEEYRLDYDNDCINCVDRKYILVSNKSHYDLQYSPIVIKGEMYDYLNEENGTIAIGVDTYNYLRNGMN
ncbi:hypothetical protein OAB57_00360 [Bacteriovoracaceae bacterium]|nr:hypothetical protein [Bacteriovoracaceae bacterium]